LWHTGHDLAVVVPRLGRLPHRRQSPNAFVRVVEVIPVAMQTVWVAAGSAEACPALHHRNWIGAGWRFRKSGTRADSPSPAWLDARITGFIPRSADRLQLLTPRRAHVDHTRISGQWVRTLASTVAQRVFVRGGSLVRILKIQQRRDPQPPTKPQTRDHGPVDEVTRNGRAKVTESGKGHGASEPLEGRLP